MRWQQVRHDLATEQQQQAPQLMMGNNQAETRVGAASEEWSSPSTGSTLRCELLIKATGHSHLTWVILHQLQGGFVKFIASYQVLSYPFSKWTILLPTPPPAPLLLEKFHKYPRSRFRCGFLRAASSAPGKPSKLQGAWTVSSAPLCSGTVAFNWNCLYTYLFFFFYL